MKVQFKILIVMNMLDFFFLFDCHSVFSRTPKSVLSCGYTSIERAVDRTSYLFSNKWNFSAIISDHSMGLDTSLPGNFQFEHTDKCRIPTKPCLCEAHTIHTNRTLSSLCPHLGAEKISYDVQMLYGTCDLCEAIEWLRQIVTPRRLRYVQLRQLRERASERTQARVISNIRTFYLTPNWKVYLRAHSMDASHSPASAICISSTCRIYLFFYFSHKINNLKWIYEIPTWMRACSACS